MGVYELSGAGSVKTGRTLYTSMNAGNQYGAMVPIASFTNTSNANIFIGNIPQTFQDLFVVGSVRSSFASTTDSFGFEWAFVNQYSYTRLIGNGSSATSARVSSAFGIFGDALPAANSTAGTFASFVVHIPNYANTTTNKTALMRWAADNNGSGNTELVVGMRSSTAPVTFFECFGSSGALAIGSTVTVYGIRAVSS